MAGATPEKRRRRVNGDLSQQRILSAATEIAAERGYEGTSIALVSERSGLPASSIYWHFTDKNALLAAVIDHSFQTWLSSAGGAAAQVPSGPVGAKLTVMMRGTASALQESSDFLRLGLMLTLEKRAEEPSARKRFLEIRHEAVERTASTYAALFPKLSDDDLHRLSTFTMAAADGLFIASEIDGTDEDTMAAFELLAVAVLAVAKHLQRASSH